MGDVQMANTMPFGGRLGVGGGGGVFQTPDVKGIIPWA